MNEETPPEPIDAAPLCLACGLCCDGSLFSRVLLDDDEVDGARRIHLAVVENPTSFEQPCTQFDGAKCARYADRPRRCAAFSCELLGRYQAGELTLDESIARVQAVKEAIARYEATIEGSGAEVRAAARMHVWTTGVRALVHEPT